MPSPLRPRRVAAIAGCLLLAACAAAPELDDRGRPIATLAPVAELVAGAPMFGLTLGAPAPVEFTANWQNRGHELAQVDAFLFTGVYENRDGPRSLRLGGLAGMMLHADGPRAPVELVELVVPFPSTSDRTEAERITGLKATHIVGTWRGGFRPLPDKMYGGHVYSSHTWSAVYATDRPGAFLLQETGAEYGGREGSLYGVVLAADEKALARGPFTAVATSVARAEAALADPELTNLGTAQLWLFELAWTEDLVPLRRRVAEAEAARDARRADRFPAELAALQQRWRERPAADVDAALQLLGAFDALCGRAGASHQAKGVGLAERHSLADDAEAVRAQGLTVTARACEVLPKITEGIACDKLLRAALQLDRAGDAIAFAELEEKHDGWLRYGGTAEAWQMTAEARLQTASRKLFAPLGERADGPAVTALREMLMSVPTPPQVRVALRDEAAAFDVVLARDAGPTALPAELDRLAKLPTDDPRRAWLSRARALAVARLSGCAAQRAEAPAIAAAYLLAAYTIEHDRWPEPELLGDVIANGSTAADPHVRAARDLLAPLLVQVLPPFRSGNVDAHQFDRYLALPPVVEWPALWQLGLIVARADELGPAFAKVTGGEAPHLRVEWHADEGSRIVVSETEPLFGSAMFDHAALAGMFLTPELTAESQQLAAECAELDVVRKALDKDVDAFSQRSAKMQQTAAELRSKAEARTMTAGELAAARKEETALNELAGPLQARERALNTRVADYNTRLMKHNDARLRHTGEQRGHYEQQERHGLLTWVEEHLAALPASDAGELVWLTTWCSTDALPCGVQRLPSRGHGLALLERYEASLLAAGGAEAIGKRLAASFTLLARCVDDANAVARRFEPLATDYAGKLGVDALFDNAAMHLPLELVAPFARAMPHALRQQLKDKADATVRAAAEQQQRSMRR
ncbi:MAG: hypothetical protein R3F29_11735 [Planctomycetota bacterium]